MAKYREYKNGIFGHKYKDYYIIRGNGKGDFSIKNKDCEVIQDKIYDYEDCEWYIDKLMATEEDIKIINHLNQWDIYELGKLMMDFMNKEEKAPKEEAVYNWCIKVRKRKIKEKEI